MNFKEMLSIHKELENFVEERAKEKFEILEYSFENHYELDYINYEAKSNKVEVNWSFVEGDGEYNEYIEISFEELELSAVDWDQHLEALRINLIKAQVEQIQNYANEEQERKLKEYNKLKLELGL